MTALLQVEDLRIGFAGRSEPVLHGVSFEVAADDWTGLIGESGSGKSLTALAVLGLLPANARVHSGRIMFRGRNLLEMSGRELREVRGKDIGMIFQNPRNSLNPLLSIGAQVARAAVRGGSEDPKRSAARLLSQVEIADAHDVMKQYPHQLSGGMCQRVLIAMILAMRPSLLIADEPTTALDVTVQAQILDLLANVLRKSGSAVLFITHDLGVVAERCATVAVMFGGSVVELGPTATVVGTPVHPYSRQLMRTYLRIDRPVDLTAAGYRVETRELPVAGCRYRDRCSHAAKICELSEMQLESLDSHHAVACVRSKDILSLQVRDER